MASITIRNVDPKLKQKLRVRAARQGHSMEQEARNILRYALGHKEDTRSLRQIIQARLAASGVAGVALPEIKREAMREPTEFRP